MPLVRIDVRKGKDVAYRQEIGRVVYEALVGVGAPKNDRFQVISEYDTDSFLFDPDYIGVHRTNDLVIIQITWNEGRNPEQKKALYKAIADGLHSAVGLRREDVFISLVEVKKENRIGTVQEIADTQAAAIDRAVEIANQIAACGPLGIQATLASAHLAIDSGEVEALSRLDAQFGALFHTNDFIEGRKAEAEGRKPVYRGN